MFKFIDESMLNSQTVTGRLKIKSPRQVLTEVDSALHNMSLGADYFSGTRQKQRPGWTRLDNPTESDDNCKVNPHHPRSREKYKVSQKHFNTSNRQRKRSEDTDSSEHDSDETRLSSEAPM